MGDIPVLSEPQILQGYSRFECLTIYETLDLMINEDAVTSFKMLHT
jgi:hypothetical protein